MRIRMCAYPGCREIEDQCGLLIYLTPTLLMQVSLFHMCCRFCKIWLMGFCARCWLPKVSSQCDLHASQCNVD